jgi:diadenosine tetraphosphate (Ap4A) HIT family hydrolase
LYFFAEFASFAILNNMRMLDITRALYNQEKKSRKSCYFCDKAVINTQECTDFKYIHWYVLINKHPYLDGNLMVIPKKHKTKLAQLSAVEWSEFSEVIVDVEKVLSQLFKTDSFNIALNEGKNSGRSVPHLHWQIIPRKKKNRNAVGIFANIEVVTLPPFDLKVLLSKK